MPQYDISSQFTDLLNQASDLLITRCQIKQKDIAGLLTDIAPLVSRIEKDSQEKARKFNVFSALGIARKEVVQSRFLAYLLDPNEHHCQGSIFLDAFLRRLGLSKITPEQVKGIRVAAEHSAGERLGRMDIVLDCQPDWLIVIENKVDADEGEQQLYRYAQWLEKQQKYNLKKLVFLTPTGHESVSGKKVQHLQLSYLDLAEIFNPLLNKIMAEAVRSVVIQYIATCRLIGGMDVATQDKELAELLTKPENIKIALEIERQTQIVRNQVVNEFGKHIQKILQKNIESANLETRWKAESIFFSDNILNLEIKTLMHQAKNNYMMRAEKIFFKSREGWSGWYRPKWVDLKSQSLETLDTKDLTLKMISDGCGRAEGWWVGWNYLREGKKSFVFTDIDDIVACLEDNRTENHPLANTIADELWRMFKTYYKDIEVLESFKQAACNL